MPKYDYNNDISLSDIPLPNYDVTGGGNPPSLSNIPMPIYNITPPPSLNPLGDIEAKLKTFYAQNKTLSLLIVAGAAYMLLKGK